ncbi:MAG: tetratricopeptide repeat protein [Deltaproteobacteria bacterium]|nr:tetratricopeptide repeat protein [Deltaproteobacteria bacterium]
MIWLLPLLLGCPKAPLPQPAAVCPTAEGELLPCAPGAFDGADAAHPLPWGSAAQGTLWYGRLLCPGGADPSVIRVESRARVTESPYPLSELGAGALGEGPVDLWRVECPGLGERDWYTDMYHCGPSCVPDGLLLLPAPALDAWVASREAADRGAWQAARDHAAHAAAIYPDAERIQYWLGFSSAEAGDLPGGMEAFARAVALDPADPDNLYQLALTQRLSGLHGLSRETVERAMAALPPGHPGRARILCLAAVTRRDQGDTEAADLLAHAACEEGFTPCCTVPAPAEE